MCQRSYTISFFYFRTVIPLSLGRVYFLLTLFLPLIFIFSLLVFQRSFFCSSLLTALTSCFSNFFLMSVLSIRILVFVQQEYYAGCCFFFLSPAAPAMLPKRTFQLSNSLGNRLAGRTTISSRFLAARCGLEAPRKASALIPMTAQEHG